MENIVKCFAAFYKDGFALADVDYREIGQNKRRFQHDGIRTGIAEFHKVAFAEQSVVTAVQNITFDAGVADKVDVGVFMTVFGKGINSQRRVFPIDIDIVSAAVEGSNIVAANVFDGFYLGNKTHTVAQNALPGSISNKGGFCKSLYLEANNGATASAYS